jgi:hypothetical protein
MTHKQRTVHNTSLGKVVKLDNLRVPIEIATGRWQAARDADLRKLAADCLGELQTRALERAGGQR